MWETVFTNGSVETAFQNSSIDTQSTHETYFLSLYESLGYLLLLERKTEYVDGVFVTVFGCVCFVINPGLVTLGNYIGNAA